MDWIVEKGWSNDDPHILFGIQCEDIDAILADAIEHWLETKLSTPWVGFHVFGCYYRLLNGHLQACPMLFNGDMESEESACDVDFYRLDEEIKAQASFAKVILRSQFKKGE